MRLPFDGEWVYVSLTIIATLLTLAAVLGVTWYLGGWHF